MRLAIITHTPHLTRQGKWYAYGPYIREMNLWVANADQVEVVAPILNTEPTAISLHYKHMTLSVRQIPAISLTSFAEVFRTIFWSPVICIRIYNAMRKADHIHLRCPGNIGLLGCLVQVLFPKKAKTAKYAGNWDPKAKQPTSYKFQKWLLSNTLLTKNMKVLVYGEWPGQSRNIVPFFTATYPKSKVDQSIAKSFEPPYRFLFVGGLTPGKRPSYVLDIIQNLKERGIACTLDFYGDGVEYFELESIISNQEWTDVRLLGNQSPETIENAFRQSYFLVLPSKSEGWPKVVAEAMFWGVIPIVTPISCVPWMVEEGERGILLSMNLQEDSDRIIERLNDHHRLQMISKKAMSWSHKYTMEDFGQQIKDILNEGTSTY